MEVIDHLRVMHPAEFDLLRYCVWCSVDCDADGAVHHPACPDVTGVFPALPGERCARCLAKLDVYVLLPVPQCLGHPQPDEDVLEVCCLGCAALAAC
jgi:hypothetical protein